MGYDFYYNPNRSLLNRGIEIIKIYPSTVSLRMLRMGSAYGIGGLSNNYWRVKF